MLVRFKNDRELSDKILAAVEGLPTSSKLFKDAVGVVSRTFENAFNKGIRYNEMTKIISALNKHSPKLCLIYADVVESVPKQIKDVVSANVSDPDVTFLTSSEKLLSESKVLECPGTPTPEEIEESLSEIAVPQTKGELDAGVYPPGTGLQSPPSEVTDPPKPIQVTPEPTTGANPDSSRQTVTRLSGKLAIVTAFLVVPACVVLIFWFGGYGSSGTKQMDIPDAQFYFSTIASQDEHVRYENGPKLSRMDSNNPIYKISPRDQIVLTFRVPSEIQITELQVFVVSPTGHTGTRTHSYAIYGPDHLYRDPDHPHKLTFPDIKSSVENRYAFEEKAGWYGFILTTTTQADVTHSSSIEIDLSNKPGPERFIGGIAEKMPIEIRDGTPNRGVVEGNTAIPKIKNLVSEVAAINRVEVLSYLFVFVDEADPPSTPKFME